MASKITASTGHIATLGGVNRGVVGLVRAVRRPEKRRPDGGLIRVGCGLVAFVDRPWKAERRPDIPIARRWSKQVRLIAIVAAFVSVAGGVTSCIGTGMHFAMATPTAFPRG